MADIDEILKEDLDSEKPGEGVIVEFGQIT